MTFVRWLPCPAMAGELFREVPFLPAPTSAAELGGSFWGYAKRNSPKALKNKKKYVPLKQSNLYYGSKFP
jgi:hypothetical protein